MNTKIIMIIATIISIGLLTGCATNKGGSFGKYDSSCGLYSCTDPCLVPPAQGCPTDSFYSSYSP